MAIVNAHGYYGCPPELLPVLEQVTQALLTQLYSYAETVYNNPEIELQDCSVERAVLERHGDSHRQLRITSHSSGYWVVIELVTPSFGILPEYRDTVDFWLFAAQRYREDKLDEQSVDWDKYEENWGMSTCDLYWQARRLSPVVPWYAPTHVIDFKHPLLLLLRQGIEAHESPESRS